MGGGVRRGRLGRGLHSRPGPLGKEKERCHGVVGLCLACHGGGSLGTWDERGRDAKQTGDSRDRRGRCRALPARPEGPALSRLQESRTRGTDQIRRERENWVLQPLTLSRAFVDKRACLFFIGGFVLQGKFRVTLSWLPLEDPGCGAGRAQPFSPSPLSSLSACWWAAAAAASSFSLSLRAAAFFSCSEWLFMWALRLFTL